MEMALSTWTGREPTGLRLDGPHNPSTHQDPRALLPYGHVRNSMASGKSVGDDMKYDYGESVEITKNAPECYRPGTQGSLCGVRHIEAEEHANAAYVKIDTILWLVEFEDGFSLEVPEEYLTSLDRGYDIFSSCCSWSSILSRSDLWV